ncbi:MAG: hypothetical protein LBI72_08275 [Flavobacteriaceae bacterium]|jgi:hypothetical protein|nr:hypothetical protein [Flavobacteriaceae bacterium]
MRILPYLALIATVSYNLTACTEKKAEANTDKKIIITEQKEQKEEAVQIPMHGTTNDKAGNERK